MNDIARPKGKRILLTGGAGFIGSHLSRVLAEQNTVTTFDLKRYASAHSDLEEVKGDVLQADRLAFYVQRADIVIHLAAIAGVGTVVKSPVTTLRVNLIGTYNLLEAARQSDLERVVVFSSSEVYGPCAFRADEDGTTSQGAVGNPRWSYAASKLAGEHLAFAYHREYGLPVVVVRPFNVYGPGQTGESAVHQFVVRALHGQDIEIYGDGTQIRAWCFVEDMVDAVLLCLSQERAIGEVFNVGNPQGTSTIFDLAERIVQISGSRSKLVFKRRDYADVDLRVPSIDKATRMLGYAPRVGLDEGLARTVEWYAHLDNRRHGLHRSVSGPETD